MASIARTAISEDSALMTGMIPISLMRASAADLFIFFPTFQLSLHSRSQALHCSLDFRERRHRCVARRGHCQRPVCSAALHGPLGSLPFQEPVYQSRGERISASDSIIDFHIEPGWRLVQAALAVADRAPIVPGGRFCV